jgi:hypothetical protein
MVHMRNTLFISKSIVLLAILFSAHSYAGVYVCVNSEGVPEYTNNKGKNCEEIKITKSSVSIPAPSRSYINNSNNNIKPANNNANSNNNPPLNKNIPPSPFFPNISNSSQQQRDGERNGILQKELQIEQKKLSDLQKEFNNGLPERHGDEKNYQKYTSRVDGMRKDIARAQGNIEAIQKEINAK